MIMGLASTDWLMALGWRQGLFVHCIEEGAPTPLPFNMPDPQGCYQARDVGKRIKNISVLYSYSEIQTIKTLIHFFFYSIYKSCSYLVCDMPLIRYYGNSFNGSWIKITRS